MAVLCSAIRSLVQAGAIVSPASTSESVVLAHAPLILPRRIGVLSRRRRRRHFGAEDEADHDHDREHCRSADDAAPRQPCLDTLPVADVGLLVEGDRCRRRRRARPAGRSVVVPRPGSGRQGAGAASRRRSSPAPAPDRTPASRGPRARPRATPRRVSSAARAAPRARRVARRNPSRRGPRRPASAPAARSRSRTAPRCPGWCRSRSGRSAPAAGRHRVRSCRVATCRAWSSSIACSCSSTVPSPAIERARSVKPAEISSTWRVPIAAAWRGRGSRRDLGGGADGQPRPRVFGEAHDGAIRGRSRRPSPSRCRRRAAGRGSARGRSRR